MPTPIAMATNPATVEFPSVPSPSPNKRTMEIANKPPITHTENRTLSYLSSMPRIYVGLTITISPKASIVNQLC